jgi:hypothetical protein
MRRKRLGARGPEVEGGAGAEKQESGGVIGQGSRLGPLKPAVDVEGGGMREWGRASRTQGQGWDARARVGRRRESIAGRAQATTVLATTSTPSVAGAGARGGRLYPAHLPPTLVREPE